MDKETGSLQLKKKIIKLKQKVKELSLVTTRGFPRLGGREEKTKGMHSTRARGQAFLARPWIVSKFREVWGY